jgi:aarF domain-containing kinase
VPEVYDELSTKRMLVMEYIDAPKISQLDRLEELQLDSKEVAHLLCEVFGEMVFCHGFVHCDPHAGNIFVRKNPDPHARTKAQLVLLDHGLYQELDEGFRQTYCDLWRGMILRDQRLVQDCAARFNAGAFGSYLPLLFTYRGAASNAPLAKSMSDAEKKQLTEELKRLQFSDVRLSLSLSLVQGGRHYRCAGF